MVSLRQTLKPWLRNAGNRLRFPRARIGPSSYVDGRSEIDAGVTLGRECRIFHARLGGTTRLGDEVIVGPQTRIVNSSVGHHGRLERDVELYGSTLGDYVTLQEKIVLIDTTVGRYSGVARETYLNAVSIGSFASIGPRTLLGTGEHPVDLVSTAPVFYSTRRQCGTSFALTDHVAERKRITLGHDVWLGAQVFVRDGVTIGDGAVVAAGAVVTADVPPYAIIGGLPAKVIRFRFPEEVIARLLRLQWWHWEEPRLRALQPWFVQPDITAFLQRAES